MQNKPLPINKSLSRTATSVRSFLEEAVKSQNENSIKILFSALAMQQKIPIEERLPINPVLDTIAYNLKLRAGHVDIAVFHSDGSATVIVVRDGTKGMQHVASGIGEAFCCGIQLAESKCNLTKVRTALLWTATDFLFSDCILEAACERSGVVPMPWGTLADHCNAMRAGLDELAAQTKARSKAKAGSV